MNRQYDNLIHKQRVKMGKFFSRNVPARTEVDLRQVDLEVEDLLSEAIWEEAQDLLWEER